MIRLINAAHFPSFARPGSLLGSSRLQSMLLFSRRMSTKISEKAYKDDVMKNLPNTLPRRVTLSPVRSEKTVNPPAGGFTAGPWDANNCIGDVGATLGVVVAAGMLFDIFYRRVTKQELQQAMEKLDAKIDKEIGKLDAKIDKGMEKLGAKIDGLTNALLYTNQRDKIAAETDNRELRKEIESLKSKGEETKTVRSSF
ncbi:MAG: hypothetical protein HW387_58 [Parachlamydiales bacterium]|nr:hypothetical protein [Parachlamydiales bacterium]